MTNVVRFDPAHPLVGTWVTMDDANAEFTVSAKGGSFAVTGRDQSDGEEFLISDVSWRGEALHFTSLMPSTGHRVKHVFRMSPSKQYMEHEYTLFEVWKRKESK
ncbi:MAG TPA: hypothetical protein VHM01_02860 [Alphaproteobacteria bacterium]|nr:hypothetical protein [Alphaproteobacteria bacterium]